ncbi:hypothetical protein EXIGLDRAFT_720148 [Exidia glandulosa HHB12029]|uniref:UBX domain-containing protein n=1 Tax=Exidia glandulosa HHB12029 TaxID=1314781 RepID=A0A165GJZ0_EXIGL|nr:hypothetical protein EXIGLDRAFT_720148 [Exidia glandulosa HHB12029]
MELDDSAQFGAPAAPRASLTSILAWPFTLTFSFAAQLFNFVFRILRIPFPRLHFAGIFGGRRPPNASRETPRDAADRFVRELEEETGAMSISRAVASMPDAAGSSSSAKAREAGALANRKILPDFFIGSYEDALTAAKRDARILCVILLTNEHDDVPEFKRTTLTDPDFVTLLNDNEFVVWGGDVRERDAYQAAIKLGATTYPFVAFVCLHPRRSNPSPSAALMTIFSSHAGLANTRAAALNTHVRATLLPRAVPFLDRVKMENAQRMEERRLRAEQDAAYEAAARADTERILAFRAEEARKAREERERLERAELEARRELNIARWRALVRPTLIPPEQPGVRLAVRLPHGARAQRSFAPSDSLDALYAFVDAQIVPHAESDGQSPDAGYEHEWAFALAVAYPRDIIPPASKTPISEIGALKSGATLVAEVKSPAVPAGDDGYEDESD